MDEEKKDEIEVIFGIKIGDKYLTLTEEAAKELYAKLHKMFGEKVDVFNYPWTPYIYSNNNFIPCSYEVGKNFPNSSSGTIYIGDNPGNVSSTTSFSLT